MGQQQCEAGPGAPAVLCPMEPTFSQQGWGIPKAPRSKCLMLSYELSCKSRMASAWGRNSRCKNHR